MGRRRGLVVRVLVLYTYDPSSNLAEVDSFHSVDCLKCTKKKKNFKKYHLSIILSLIYFKDL